MKRSLETAAHCTTSSRSTCRASSGARKQLGSTYLPIVARCVIDALREFPALNAWLEGEHVHRARRRSTSASPCRSARTG